MIIDQQVLNELSTQARLTPRLRMNLDLRNSPFDSSCRMLNAVEPGSPEVIHRHRHTNETVAILRGHFQELFYNEDGSIKEVINLVPGGPVVAISVPAGQWHTARALVPDTVIIACKDGPWEPLKEEDILR